MANQTARRWEVIPQQALSTADAAVVVAQQNFPVVHSAIEKKKESGRSGKGGASDSGLLDDIDVRAACMMGNTCLVSEALRSKQWRTFEVRS